MTLPEELLKILTNNEVVFQDDDFFERHRLRINSRQQLARRLAANLAWILATVEVRHKMGALTTCGRKLAGRNQALPQQQLLIFPIKNNDLHDQILILPEQRRNLRSLIALRGLHFLPLHTVETDSLQ